MLNIGKLRPGGENYYLNSVAKGVEDYYLGSGEAPGYWIASGADALGLSGEVTEVGLGNVLRGSDPLSGAEFVAPRKGERVPGFDLTFRAPKSVALLHALGPKEASNEVVSAHDAAVAASLDYLERVASGARRGKGGKTSIESKGFIGAAFRHRTSRAGDPLLHTHVLVANLIQGVDGKWGAVDARHLYLHAKTAGYLYQAHLRMELTRRLGVAWGPVRNGTADIDGISRDVVRGFSRRRREIEQATAGRDHVSRREAEVAALATRQAKDYGVSPEQLLPEWKERAERLGLSSEDLAATLERTEFRRVNDVEQARLERDLAAPEGLTAQASTFSRREAIQGVCGQLGSGSAVADVEAMADRFLVSDDVVPLDGAGPLGRFRLSDSPIAAGTQESRYSTVEMLATERRVIECAVARRLDQVAVVRPAVLSAALGERPSLHPDQAAMVARLATSGAGVELVVGKAGTGKTYALGAAREAWEASGHRVLGCALAAKAARELQNGSGISSTTLAKLLHALDDPRKGGFAPGTVVVLDEAGMVGTRDLERLLSHAARDRAKVVLVGDDAQLPAIAAGGAFRGIKNRLPSIELTEVRRQPNRWERDALELIRAGKAVEAVEAYTARDRVFAATDADETRTRLVDDWWASFDTGEEAVMIAARRSDVAALNAEARARMTETGRLRGDPLEAAGRAFCEGDIVMTTRNNMALDIDNGTLAEVIAIDHERRTVTLRTHDGAQVALPRPYVDDGHLTHAYAVTGHKSQGMTVDRTFVLVDETLYREWGYTAMSRGRVDNRLYVVAGVDLDREDTGGQVARAADPMPALTRALGRSRAKELALDRLELEELKTLSEARLRTERSALRRQLGRVPQDPTRDLERVTKERAQLERLIGQENDRAQVAASELRALGPIARLRRRGTEPLAERIRRARAAQARAQIALDGAEREQRRLRDALTALEKWRLENAPVFERCAAVEEEMGRRGISVEGLQETSRSNELEGALAAEGREPHGPAVRDETKISFDGGIEASLEL
ncbi:MAG: relaxase domain-containing protein [Actinomycetota bacterium]|nr:relaxase domain-containing protein [Actinomycetota bacterium]